MGTLSSRIKLLSGSDAGLCFEVRNNTIELIGLFLCFTELGLGSPSVTVSDFEVKFVFGRFELKNGKLNLKSARNGISKRRSRFANRAREGCAI